MKDNFSAQAKDYSKYRPHYPKEMMDYILSFVEDKTAALDVATGNGQVAIALADHFQEVYATDISSKQLENATKKENVQYKEEGAEHTSFADGQFNLITVAQAIHWFEFDAFYAEVKRLLKPGGVLAVLGYGLFYTNEDTHRVLHRFYHEIIGPYWDPERRYIDEDYQTIPFPFEELPSQKFENRLTWTYEQLCGYLETWSAVQHYIRKNGSNPLDLVRPELKESWEKNDKQVTFPLLLRLGKL